MTTNSRFVRFHLFLLLIVFFVTAGSEGAFQAVASELSLQAQLVWGTNGEKSSNPSHKEVEAKLRDKLCNVFKWKKYFEVERKCFAIPPAQKIKLSEDCTIDVKHLSGSTIEVRLIGKSHVMLTKRQMLTRNESLVLAGDGKNDTAWFVVVTLVGSK